MTMMPEWPGSARTAAGIMIAMLGFFAAATYAETAAPAFEADAQLRDNARKWAAEFVAFAADRYDVELDGSEVSIKYLDEIAADIHASYTAEAPPDDLVRPIARAFGSYIAEVYVAKYGGEWGWVRLDEGSFPGVRASSGSTFLPLKRAEDRIRHGDEFDIWEYYQKLTTL